MKTNDKQSMYKNKRTRWWNRFGWNVFCGVVKKKALHVLATQRINGFCIFELNDFGVKYGFLFLFLLFDSIDFVVNCVQEDCLSKFPFQNKKEEEGS